MDSLWWPGKDAKSRQERNQECLAQNPHQPDPALHPIQQRIEEFCHKWPDADYGLAHIVLGDYNLEDYHIAYCRGLIQGALHVLTEGSKWSVAELKATYDFLEELERTPEQERTDWYADRSDDEGDEVAIPPRLVAVSAIGYKNADESYHTSWCMLETTEADTTARALAQAEKELPRSEGFTRWTVSLNRVQELK